MWCQLWKELLKPFIDLKIDYQVNARSVALVSHIMNFREVDVIQMRWAKAEVFAADVEYHIIIGDYRHV